MTFLLNRCRKRSRLTEELVEEVWLNDHRSAMFVYSVEDAISECLELAILLQQAWKATLEQLFNEEIDDIDGAYLVLVNTVERSIATFERLDRLVQDIAGKGFSVEHIGELAESISNLKILKHEVETKWPVVDPAMIAASMAAYRRGEYQLSEDLLRDAQSDSSQAS